jgi:hypothetical protein
MSGNALDGTYLLFPHRKALESQNVAGGAAREMQVYWQMFGKIPGVGNASLGYLLNSWKFFITSKGTVDGAQNPAFQEMDIAGQNKWASAYLYMVYFVSKFK